MERGSVYHVVSILSAFGVNLLRYKCIALYLDKDQGAEIRNKQSETIYSICLHMYNQHIVLVERNRLLQVDIRMSTQTYMHAACIYKHTYP